MVDQKLKVLVLGGKGLVGHVVTKFLQTRDNLKVNVTHHSPTSEFSKFDGLKPIPDLQKIFETSHFDYVINAIGLLQHYIVAKEADYKAINTQLPLILVDESKKLDFKLIHISTDAVFAPDSGPVNEFATPTPIDLYGQSKLLGEVQSKNCLTIRTSIIGLDPLHHRGLLERALTQKKINGFANQSWSGCTNLQLAQFMGQAIENNLTGLIHFAPLGPISKYELLRIWAAMFPEKDLIVTKARGLPVSRYLITKNPSIHQDYSHDITQTLIEMINFEKGLKYDGSK